MQPLLAVLGRIARRVGFVGVRGLQKGECRILGKAEHDRLRALVGLKP